MSAKDSNSLVPSAAAAAMRPAFDASRIKSPEDLPPSLARKIATIMAEEPPSLSAALKHMAKWTSLPLLVMAVLPMLAGLHAAAAVASGVGLLGFTLGTLQTKRQTPFFSVAELLKAAGVPWLARWRIHRRLVKIVGPFPPADVAKRLDADTIVARLGAQGEEPGVAHPAAEVPALSHAGELPRQTARVAAEQLIAYRRKMVWVLGTLMPFIVALQVYRFIRFDPTFRMMDVFNLLFPLGAWYFGSRSMRAPLEQAGLTAAEAKEATKVLFRSRRAVKRRLKAEARKLNKEDLLDAVVDQWLDDLGAPPSAAALGDGSGGDDLAVPATPVPVPAADEVTAG